MLIENCIKFNQSGRIGLKKYVMGWKIPRYLSEL